MIGKVIILVTIHFLSLYYVTGLTEQSPIKPLDTGIIPIQPIPGTNLFTGIYYRIKNQALTPSWLTWVWKDKKEDKWVDFRAIADTKGSPYYEKGNKWEHDLHWVFVPTELNGWYLWFNRRIADMTYQFRPTAVSDQSSPDGKLVDIYGNKEQNKRLAIGGDMRDKVYWKPVPQEDGYFKIMNANYGTLTWADTTDGEYGQYLQVVKNDSLMAQEKLEHQFIPQGITLNARISDFQFQDTPETLLKQYTEQDTEIETTKQTISNPSLTEAIKSPARETFYPKTSFTWTLNQNMGIFRKVITKVEVPLIASGEIPKCLEKDLEGGQEWSQQNGMKIEIQQDVSVPANSSVVISASTYYIKDLPLEFTAEMVITGTVEGRALTADGQGGSDKVSPAPAELISQVIQDNKDFDAELIGMEGNWVRYRVSGTFKGTFGVKGIITLDDGPK